MGQGRDGQEGDVGHGKALAFHQLKACTQPLMLQAGQTKIDHKGLALALENLTKVVQGVDAAVLDPTLVNYIFVPLSHLLKRQDLSEHCIIFLFRLLQWLLDHAWWKSMVPRLAEQLIILFLVTITGPPKTNVKEKTMVSGDIQKAVVGCLAALFKARKDYPTDDLKHHFNQAEKRNFMAHLIVTMLDLAESSANDPELRIDSLELLYSILNHWLVKLESLKSILPGTLSTCCKIIVAGSGSHRVIFSAVTLASLAITKTMADRSHHRGKNGLAGPNELVKYHQNQVNTRTKAPPLGLFAKPEPEKENVDAGFDHESNWLNATKSQVKLALGSITFLSKSQDSRLRRAVFQLMTIVLERCHESLDNCQELAISALLLAAGDEEQSIVQWAVNTFQSLTQGTNGQKVLQLIQAVALQWESTLPKILNGANEDKKVSILRSISASHQILGVTPMSLDSIEKIGQGLVTAILPQFESRLSVKFGQITDSLEEIPRQSKTIVTFARLGPQSAEAFKGVLIQYGQSAQALDIAVILSKFVNQENSALESMAALWCLAQVLSGVETNDRYKQDEKSRIVRHIIEDLIRNKDSLDRTLARNSKNESKEKEDDVFKHLTPTLLQDGQNNAMTRFNMKNDKVDRARASKRENVKDLAQMLLLHETMIMQIIESASVIIGFDFRSDLIDVLYYLLQRLSDPEWTIANCAKKTIQGVAFGCQYDSTDLMIIENADYVVNAVSQDLNFAALTEGGHRAPFVLSAMSQMVGQEIVPMMQDVIEEVFDALDAYHGYDHLCAALLGVLFSVIATIKPPETDRDLASRSTRRPVPMAMGDDNQLFADFKQWYLTRNDDWDNGLPNDEGPDESTTQGQEDSTSAGSLDKYQLTTQLILKKCKQFLSHPSNLLRHRMLQIMTKGFQIMKYNQKQLLPLVHEIWPSILRRLKEDDLVIQEQAILCIGVLCEASGDFMSQRIVKDAIPVFEKIVNLRRKTDRDAISRPDTLSIGFSSLFRFEIALMDCLNQIIKQTPIDPGIVWRIGLLFKTRLDMGNKDVQRSCQGLFETMAEFFPDLTWILLRDIDQNRLVPAVARAAVV